MNLSFSYFIWNSWKNFPVKSVFRKLIKMLCWLWNFTYATLFNSPYGNISSCFTDIIFATIAFSLIHYRWDVARLIVQIKWWPYVSCFPNNSKGVFYFCKTFQFSDKLQCIMFIWSAKCTLIEIVFQCLNWNSQLRIKESHFFWSELKVDWMKRYEKLAPRYFLLIRCFSKSLETLCAPCKSPRIAFCLYFLRTGDDQWLGILKLFYYDRCFNDNFSNPNFHIQECTRIYLGFICNFMFGW